jgi:threonine/homoserine/homoserine lactone efflux protein
MIKLDQESKTPMTFMEAALFQYVNPKAWMMAVTGVGTFTTPGSDYWVSASLIALVFLFVCFFCVSVWTIFGSVIGRFLNTPRALKTFNIVMGILTASCLLMIW